MDYDTIGSKDTSKAIKLSLLLHGRGYSLIRDYAEKALNVLQ